MVSNANLIYGFPEGKGKSCSSGVSHHIAGPQPSLTPLPGAPEDSAAAPKPPMLPILCDCFLSSLPEQEMGLAAPCPDMTALIVPSLAFVPVWFPWGK